MQFKAGKVSAVRRTLKYVATSESAAQRRNAPDITPKSERARISI